MSDTPKRVLMTGDTVGGVWTFTLELSEALAALGVHVVLCTFGGAASAEQVDHARCIPHLTLIESDAKVDWMDDPWDDVERAGQRLLALASELEPDIIHLNTYGHGALPWQKPVVLTAHSCVLSWWAAVRRTALPPTWNRYQDEVRRSLQAVSLVTAPTYAMLRTLEMNYGPGIAPGRVIYNGRNSMRFFSAQKEDVILTAGRLWDDAKNVAAVAQVAPRLYWPVYVAGDTRHPDGSCRQLPGCQLLGSLTSRSLAEWMARARIYVMPARYEPFGLSILEAALSRCALVLGDIESLREVWADTAIFVPPDDTNRLERALLELMEDSAQCEKLARRSFERARTFTPAGMAYGYMQAYQFACSQGSACVS